MSTQTNASEVPLCVDLDGTLVHTDMLLESTLCLIKQSPYFIFMLPIWLLMGKARLKSEVAKRVDMKGYKFPFNNEVLDYVHAERKTRPTILVTGSHRSLAEMIAEQTDAFDRVIGSNDEINLTSSNKRNYLVGEFGENGFDYIGNDTDDLNVWPSAKSAMLVGTQAKKNHFKKIEFSRVFNVEAIKVKEYFKLIRIHQWLKNLLVFVPFLLDQRLFDMNALMLTCLGFIAISMLASATYIVNDMLDLQADRVNETKSKRSLPSGRIPLGVAAGIAAALVVATLLVASLLPAKFNFVLLVYLVLTLLYSFVLKRLEIVDVITIACLHTLRVVAGTLVIGAEWSFWLLAFSMFVFFGLALAKRVAELFNLGVDGKTETAGRSYKVSDIPLLTSMGISAGHVSVLVVALYINSDKVTRMYSEPRLLWLVCPVLLYWIGRIWMKTSRGEMHEDPVVFAMRDRVSVFAILTMMVIVGLAVFSSLW